MAARYWVGGTATWDGTAGSKWALTSGGAGGQAVPTSADTVFFDANSGANTITLGVSPTVVSVTMTGFTGTFDGVGSLYTITLNSTGTIWNAPATATINGSPNITLTSIAVGARTFQGGGKTYGTLTIGGTTGTFNLFISGINTFNTLASTKTVAYTIQFSAAQTITNWTVSGTSGNVITVKSDSGTTTRVLTITNQTSGIDYLDITDITSNLAPITFYAGANTLLRSNVIGVAATTPTANQVVYVLTSGTSFTTPANWNNANNEIHLFGGGGGGAGSRFTTPNGAGGGGGGGGGYTKATNVTLSGSITYAIGAGGNGGSAGGNGSAGGSTTFKSGTYTTTGGGGGQATATSSTGGTAGTGSTYNGGVGGQGSLSTVALTGNGSGGGAGAGGPLGAGKNGGNGFASTTTANIAGGGGGGNGGGTVGGNASSATGGTGGNNNAGVGGGASNVTGFNGGGSGGTTTVGAVNYGSCGIDIVKSGMGSGSGAGGACGANAQGVNGGLFGGGGCGGALTTANVTNIGGRGGQGGIIIIYSTSTTAINSNFFLMF